jgi:hypothetical protein
MSSGRKRMYTCWSWPKMDTTFFLPNGRGLIVDEHWHARGRKQLLYVLALDENRYDLFPPKSRGLTVDEHWHARMLGRDEKYVKTYMVGKCENITCKTTQMKLFDWKWGGGGNLEEWRHLFTVSLLSTVSSTITSVSLKRIGYNATNNYVNAVCITRTFAYACWLLRYFVFHKSYFIYYVIFYNARSHKNASIAL